MTIVHVKRQPPTYNAIQWTGDNYEEIQTAMNINLLRVDMNYFAEKLNIMDKFTNGLVAMVPINSWIISSPYNGAETDQFGTTLEVMSDEDFQAQFIMPTPPADPVT